jgi:hypothetical protein
MSPASKAALYRALPVTLGAIIGVVAALAAPSSAQDAFYSTAAQVLPVLLLALAIEARVFGGHVRRFPHSKGLALVIESMRWLAGAVIVAALIIAEWCALYAVLERGGTRDPSIVYLGLAAGFITVGLQAFLGARPRVVADLGGKLHSQGTKLIVRAGMGNQYGESDGFGPWRSGRPRCPPISLPSPAREAGRSAAAGASRWRPGV